MEYVAWAGQEKSLFAEFTLTGPKTSKSRIGADESFHMRILSIAPREQVDRTGPISATRIFQTSGLSFLGTLTMPIPLPA